MLGKLKVLCEIIIVTISAYYLAVGAYLIVKPVDVVRPEVETTLSDANIRNKYNKGYFDIINKRNLFAAFDPANVVRKPKKKPKPANDLNKLPVAAANFRLIGTVYASDPALRRAVIIVNGKGQIFKNGQAFNGVKITDIKRRAVVLLRGKRKEILMIDKDDKNIANKSDSGNVLLSKSKLKQVLANPEDLLSKIDFAPAKVDGRKGLLISRVPRQSVLANAGVKKGDLIVSVNGKNLSSLADIMDMASMRVKDSIEIKIWRNKRLETLKLKFSNA